MARYHAIDGLFDSVEESTLLSHANSTASFLSSNANCENKCVTSRSAIITLFWYFIISLIFGVVYQIHNKNVDITGYFIIAIFMCFYPLAGSLADLKFGRYNTIIGSMYSLLIILPVAGVAFLTRTIIQLPDTDVSALAFSIIYYIGVVLFFIFAMIIAIFNANVIQFGMDQLHDSPGDHQSLFIHWYYWTWNTGYLASQFLIFLGGAFPIDLHKNNLIIFSVAFAFIVSSIVLSLCIAYHRKRWFLIDSARLNPYKLVYAVTKFARQHKVPVRRSAFTYCEDEVPSGLDLGKAKYGGPFTTEQVEDVKAVYGILKILLAMGPVFFIGIATDRLLVGYYLHIRHPSHTQLETVEFSLLGNGLLSTLLIVAIIPLYIHLVRPLIFPYIPGMLKRIGLGIILMLASLICSFTLDSAAHLQRRDETICMLQFFHNTSSDTLSQNVIFLVIPQCLASCYNMLIYIALYEFICAQSPHSTKGLLIGLSFATKGAFELLAIVVMTLFSKFIRRESFPSCGMEYYILNICVGIMAVILYTYVTKKYKYKLRDEPCHVYRYVEEYYSKIQDKRLQHYSGGDEKY